MLHITLFLSFMVAARCTFDGGWTTDETERIAQPGPCNIDVVDVTRESFSQKFFLDNYAYTQPVVIQKSNENEVFKAMCTKDKLFEIYGDNIIRLSTAETYSYRKRDIRLKRYVNDVMKAQTLDTFGNDTFYWFGDNNYEEWKELFKEYNPPPYKLPKMNGVYSFGLAAAGTGVPFHFHGPGFGEVIFGRKRWFLYPPEKQPSFNPNKTTLHWLMEDYKNLHPADMPLECTLGPGEAIYFPDRWWHGTLNIDTSVFISTFFG